MFSRHIYLNMNAFGRTVCRLFRGMQSKNILTDTRVCYFRHVIAKIKHTGSEYLINRNVSLDESITRRTHPDIDNLPSSSEQQIFTPLHARCKEMVHV